MSTLFARFVQNPIQIASIFPSSRWLAKDMAKRADPEGETLELGAGTGPITSELMKRLDPAHFEIVELDPELAEHLCQRFPTVRIYAEDAEEILKHSQKRYRTILSGIAFVWMEKDKRHRLFELIRDRLEPGGSFVLFQYSRISEKELQEIFGKEQVTSTFVPLNLPPAFVYTCRK